MLLGWINTASLFLCFRTAIQALQAPEKKLARVPWKLKVEQLYHTSLGKITQQLVVEQEFGQDISCTVYKSQEFCTSKYKSLVCILKCVKAADPNEWFPLKMLVWDTSNPWADNIPSDVPTLEPGGLSDVAIVGYSRFGKLSSFAERNVEASKIEFFHIIVVNVRLQLRTRQKENCHQNSGAGGGASNIWQRSKEKVTSYSSPLPCFCDHILQSIGVTMRSSPSHNRGRLTSGCRDRKKQHTRPAIWHVGCPHTEAADFELKCTDVHTYTHWIRHGLRSTKITGATVKGCESKCQTNTFLKFMKWLDTYQTRFRWTQLSRPRRAVGRFRTDRADTSRSRKLRGKRITSTYEADTTSEWRGDQHDDR